MGSDATLNLGQFPRRNFEDLRMQTQSYLDSCDPSYFFHYPSHPGIVIRQLHCQLASFSRFSVDGLRCLIWGRAGDVVHVHKYLSQFSFGSEIHAVVADEEDMSWAQAQTPATVWLEKNEEQYCSPPYAPVEYFNCVLIMGRFRSSCLSEVERYIVRSEPHLLLAVDEEPSYCHQEKGYHYQGGPLWRG
jgi:hypothetical protein|tara:strand:- start:11919 stop:12485 length:567 start_codon:yes stop_codon:yes gene_type:complete